MQCFMEDGSPFIKKLLSLIGAGVPLQSWLEGGYQSILQTARVDLNYGQDDMGDERPRGDAIERKEETGKGRSQGTTTSKSDRDNLQKKITGKRKHIKA